MPGLPGNGSLPLKADSALGFACGDKCVCLSVPLLVCSVCPEMQFLSVQRYIDF